MVNIFIVALSSAIVFFFFKFIEMRFILKESIPLKNIVRDTIIVYISMIAGQFVIAQMGNFKGSVNPMKNSTKVFTGDAGF
mgnify:CR=1 FL=1|tara:strand:+ start:497 stop:739 length:243 start_codon:yes stop_codon:yes gene_type:complete